MVACVRHAKLSLPQWLVNAPLYGIGSIASYWFVSRTVLIF